MFAINKTELMHFFFAKLFDEYQRKGDPAVSRITIYISLIYSFALFGIYFPISEILLKRYFEITTQNKAAVSILIFGVLGIVTVIVYIIYIRGKLIYRLSEKYKNKNFSKVFLYVLVVITPVTLLLAGATITVLLKGGTILGKHVDGIF